MAGTYTHKFDTPVYKGEITINTGLFINNKWVAPVEGKTVITSVSVGTSKDVDIAVKAAEEAYKNVWGLRCSGRERGKLLYKLATLIERDADEFSALEALDVGKVFAHAKAGDVGGAINTIRYYAGWADKIQGKTIETTDAKFTYTRHEPYGAIVSEDPYPTQQFMASWKLGPALATGNTVVLKPSELTPLTALKLADLIVEAGFPPGVVNIVNGYGHEVGQAITEHPRLRKVAFTGSTVVGRKVMKASADTNLKVVTLELGGKSPTIIFDDADLEKAVRWASFGILQRQACTAGSRIFVQEGIYNNFLPLFQKATEELTEKTGDPFGVGTQHGPQVSQTQFDRVMGFIEHGKSEGAKILIGGERHGTEGYFIKPTIITDVHLGMKLTREEIFGPVCTIIKFKTEEEVIEKGNDTEYGLGSNIFTENLNRAIRVSNAIQSGSSWVNIAQVTDPAVPFGGYKHSGIGRELGEYALDTYTQVKGVHINLGP
ncbi:aldehyde dehydrogenase [Pholiota conissans]|uniref:Aldehyde dehydrogenase n=1 Tax=Pholiota conissans TaxID=109636 RepID=A0A9P5YRR8_9AGAR|nr:aldehyde dehydrogenase [Pholiota conissans]